MSILSNLLFRSNIPAFGDVPHTAVSRIVLDSRQAVPGALFCALRGGSLDGNEFAEQALAKGCVAVLTDRPDCAGLPLRVHVPSVAEAVGPLCRVLHGEPDQGMKIFAVTGTNGKTTSVFLAEAVFAEAGLAPALSSTVVVRHPGFEEASGMTTPDAVRLWEWITRSRAAGARSLAVEVSSHALDQERIGGLMVDVAVFTNLTHDHLDYHGGMAEYFAAKSRLFTRHLKSTGIAVVNADDPHGRILSHQLGDRSRTFGFSGDDLDWTIADFRNGLDGMSFRLRSRAGSELTLHSPLMGRVFAQNLAGVAVAMLEIGIPAQAVEAAAARVTVPGRCQPVRRGSFRGIVDYAHTPDALERLLEGLRSLVPGRILTVFGCGGDRDRTKRPLMGGIAERLSDLAILTSDNPRTEDPEAILDQVAAGMSGTHHRRIADRAEAIRAAVAEMGPDDLVVVAGKGHEDYQILGTEKHHFDDREVLGEALAARGNRP